jgi:ATP-dependent RNA helicase SUPV3L1/SUV3
LFAEIEENLSAARKGFLAASLVDEDDDLRSLEDAKHILNAISQIFHHATLLLKEYPSLESLFEKDYGPLKELTDRESVLEVCFLYDYLFPETQAYPLAVDQQVDLLLLENYVLSFREWCEEKKKSHQNCQKKIKEHFDIDLKTSQLDCQCIKCIADYRATLRDTIFKAQVELINQAEEELHDLVLIKKINDISDYVKKLKKSLEKNIHKVRYRLKRGSLNKLDSDVKAHFKSKLGPGTDLSKVYREKLMAFYNGVLDDMGIKPDLISTDEYDRFFTQLGVGMWRPAGFLRKEFEKLIKSIMAFKRKDISASILRDYLGQFWLHASARRKKRKVIYHMGPTNSGKTYNAIEALAQSKHGCYLAPLRLLASELYDTLNDKGVKTTLLTGEEVIEIDGATHYSSTIEMAKLHEEFDCVVIDEIQMITDPQRGWAWTRALVNIDADEVHLCGDPSVFELVEKILNLTGDTLEVKNYERKTKLSVEKRPLKLVDLQENDALIVFSRRNALKYKMDLENLGFKVSIVYGRLSPEVRREQARKFDQGETDIMVSTDAIAMGMNLPVRRIVFSTLSKFINSKEFPITNSEIKQIAGRAGRFQRFPEGFASCLQQVDDGLDRLEVALNYKLAQKELAMVGPDLEIFKSVNSALAENNLPTLSLSEFLRLFNTMTFEKPFFCVDLKEMIEVAEMVEEADEDSKLSDSEIFGFACAPVNLGLMEHVQYFVWMLNHYVGGLGIQNEDIDIDADDIDYLETAIKCVELYQWLARHFENKNFMFDPNALIDNKSKAIERLNQLLSEKTSRRCSSCGVKLPDSFSFNICESCFGQRRFGRRRDAKEKSGKFSKKRPSRRNKNFNKNKDNSKKLDSKSSGSRKKKSSNRKRSDKASAFKRHR